MNTRTQPMPHRHGHHRIGFLSAVAAFVLIPVLGYAVMHGLVYVFPMTEQALGRHLVVTLAIVALGLAVPYWMLKAGLFAAHRRNPREQDVHMSELPKSKRPAGRFDIRDVRN